MYDVTMKIAGFVVTFRVRERHLLRWGGEFFSNEPPQTCITVTPEQVQHERDIGGDEAIPFSYSYLEYTAAYRAFADWMWTRDAFVLHGASFCVDGQGVIFCAPSGTGKTTHLCLWKQLLGDRMTVINGDKPVIRLADGQPVVCGSPYNGKENYGCNTSAPLRHVCFIERSEQNRVEPAGEMSALQRLLRQMNVPKLPGSVAQAYAYADALFRSCEFHTIYCNTELSAAQTAYTALFGSEETK